MLKIEQGTARDVGIRFWEIVDPAGVRLTEFRHSRFANILNGAQVYFVDLDLDPRFCDNVQASADVDGLVALARPQRGFGPGAEDALRSYIMAALANAVRMRGQPQRSYLASLRTKMESVGGTADGLSQSATLALLRRLGITS